MPGTTEPLPPVYLVTAIEAVVRAGQVQMARVGTAMRIDKKGAIDLVTEIDTSRRARVSPDD